MATRPVIRNEPARRNISNGGPGFFGPSLDAEGSGTRRLRRLPPSPRRGRSISSPCGVGQDDQPVASLGGRVAPRYPGRSNNPACCAFVDRSEVTLESPSASPAGS